MKPKLKIIQNAQFSTTNLYRNRERTSNEMPQTRANKKLPALFPVSTASAPVSDAALEIKVTEVKATKGQIMLAIYDKETDFSKTMKIGTAQPAIEGEVLFSFPKLPIGNYAVMVFHDTNNNGKLDTNLLGIPKEPWGGSLQGKKVFGTPRWSDARFNLPEDGLTLTIPLQ